MRQRLHEVGLVEQAHEIRVRHPAAIRVPYMSQKVETQAQLAYAYENSSKVLSTLAAIVGRT